MRLEFAVLVLFLNGCLAWNLFGSGSVPSVFGEPNLSTMRFFWNQDVGFHCVTYDLQASFTSYYLRSTEERFSNIFLGLLNNGKDISVFVIGLEYKMSRDDFLIAKKWYKKSGRNICFIEYLKPKSNVVSSIIYMVTEHVWEFVAKLTGDLILEIWRKSLQRKDQRGVRDMSHVQMSGWSFGAHIASRACRYVFNMTGTKVRFLQGIDPAGIFLRKTNYIQSGDALYVQNIHSSKLLGTWHEIADANIYIKSDFSGKGPIKNSVAKHYFALEVFFAICTQKIHLLAEQYGKGSVYLVQPERNNRFPRPNKLVKRPNDLSHLPGPNATQVVVGPYGAMQAHQGRRFQMSLVGFESTIDTLMHKFSSILVHYW